MLKLVPMPLRQYAKLTGRITRSQFLRWLGFLLLAYIVAATLDLRIIAPMLGYLPFEEVEEKYLTWATAALLVVPYVTSNIRRLHDVNRSGWWMLFAIVPMLVLYFSNEIGFSLYGSLSGGLLFDVLPMSFSELVINWLPWVVIALAIASFGPVIVWSLKKGSNEPNKYGTRN